MRNSYKGKVTMGMPKFEGQEVMVVSQFNQPKLLKVEKPKKLCNPIDKNDEGIINPILTCGGHPQDNQFGTLQLDTKKEAELCVPSVKTVD